MAELRQIVRIINADIPGERQIHRALMHISGIGPSFSVAICNVLKMNHHKKVGSLSPEEVKKIEDVIKNPLVYKIPPFMVNRRRDPETGKDLHTIGSDLRLSLEFDIKRLKKIRSYRGIRHAQGLPLRGQKTRSNFRKGKAVGVSKKKTAK